MKKLAFRDMIGAEKFDRIMSGITEEQIERGRAVKSLSERNRQADPEKGMTIEDGRKALSEAAGRSYRLGLTGVPD